MRLSLVMLGALLGLALPVGAIQPFGDAFPTTLEFSEDYTDALYFDGEYQEYDTFTDTLLLLDARASMRGIDPASFTDTTYFSVTSGSSFNLSFALGDGQRTTTADGTTVTWSVWGYDPIMFEPAIVGEVSIHWNGVEFLLHVDLQDDPDDYSILAPDYAGEKGPIEDVAIVSLQIGPYGFENRLAYVKGTASIFSETAPDREVFDDLEKVRLSGKFDSTPPDVEIVSPAANATVSSSPITVSGTAADEHAVTSVEVSVNGGDFVPAQMDGSGGWALAGVELVEGVNVLVARAADPGGNIGASAPGVVRLEIITPLVVSAAGNAPGQVTSGFFPPLQYVPGQPALSRTTPQQDGEMLTVVAGPAPDAVFDGWTSNEPLTAAQAGAARLEFLMRPNLTLTAHFLINPFTSVHGKYSGLIASEIPAHRGLMTAKISRFGAFTATVRMGGSTIPIAGRFSNTGRFTTTVTVDGFTYRFDLTLNVTGGGSKSITGTLTGIGLDATVSAALAPFKKATNPAPQAGAYTVLLPPAGENDATYPAGIGFGRVNVSARGVVKFAGRLGEGTPVLASALLSADGTSAFYAPLYENIGVISGPVSFDLANPAHDVSGQLEWFKPSGFTPAKPHPEGFSGRSALIGAKFIVPPPGERLFLVPTNGAGTFGVDAPGFDAPALAVDLPAFLAPDDQLKVSSPSGQPVKAVAVAVFRDSETFRGTFLDATTGETRKFSGAIIGSKVNAAGGFFRRGLRTGSIQITPPVAP